MLKKKTGYLIASVSVCIGLLGLIFSVIGTRAATLTPGPLSISYAGDQLFNETNIEPGDVFIKDISITNTGTLPHSFSMSAGNVSGNLANVIQIEPRDGGSAIWNETLANLAAIPNGSKVVIASIGPKSTKNLQIAAIFPSASGNEFQGQSSANFSFIFGNESTDKAELSSFTSLRPRSLGQSIISAITYNPPSEDTSQAQPDQTNSNSDGTAKGTTTVVKELCFWWLVALVILIISLILYYRYNKGREKLVVWWLWPILFAAALYVVHYYVDKSYQQTIFCHWFWAIEAATLIVYYIFELRSLRENQN